MRPELIFQTPAWYLIFCVLAALIFSGFTYFKENQFKKNQRLFLSALRGLLVFFVSFLLLGPLIKYVNQLILKPKVLILIDNSKSMNTMENKAIVELRNGLKALQDYISSNDFETEVRSLDSDRAANSIDDISFGLNKTNLSEAFTEIKNSYEGQNLSDVILVSDGIINQGVSPTFQKYPFNIHSVGFGDTTSRKDLAISGVAANKIAYLGNRFNVNIDFKAELFKGKTTLAIIKNSQGKVLATKSITFSSNEDFQTVSFELLAEKEGKQRFIAEIKALEGEYTIKNNVKDFLIEVVNGKEKILLLAYAPHPDIKALKTIIEKNDFFELKIQILSNAEPGSIGKEPFDLLILHNIPDIYNSSNAIVNSLLAQKKPTFFFLGGRSNVQLFNGLQNVFSISGQTGKIDKVSGAINPAFQRFIISENTKNLLDRLPPLSSPFGEYKIQPGSEVILFQEFSNINTGRPLLAINSLSDKKIGVFAGEGLWQWRLEEFSLENQHLLIDDLIVKTIQLLSIKEDKSKLRVYPAVDNFELDQKVVFVAEAYDNIFERIYNQNVSLNIKSDNGRTGSYSFTITPETSKFELSNLPAGLYNYTASAEILGKKETTFGQFMVSHSDIESQNIKADFDLLKTISNENNGDFVFYKNTIELRNSLKNKGLVNKVISNEEMKDFINLKWLLFLIIGLASLEWGIRKYLGGY